MKALKLTTVVSEDRQLMLQLPDDVSEGPAEVVVLISEQGSSTGDILDALPTLPESLWSRAEIERNLREDKLSGELVAKLRSRLGDNLRQIVAFGSRARGAHRPDSDFDCLAILEELSPAAEEAIDAVAGELLDDHDIVVSILPVAEETYRASSGDPLFRNVRKEGVVLWTSEPEPSPR